MPSNRGTRAQVAPNIYRDTAGYSVIVTVGSGPRRRAKEKRYPLGADFAEMKRWRDDTRKALRAKLPRGSRSEPGTLNAAIKQYLKSIKALDSRETRGYELDAWVPAFGGLPRGTITPAELNGQLHEWRASGVAASTCNHRRNALIQLWRALDGPEAENPAQHTTHFREPSGEPRELPADSLDELVAAMPPSRTRAMYRLMLETGWPPARIRRMKPEHIAWEVPSVYLEDRRKGHGTTGRHYGVSRRGLDALREFDACDAYGGVTRQSIYLVFARALKVVNRAREKDGRPLLSTTLRPYDARHTVGTHIYRATSDVYAAAEVLGVSLETALRYTRAAIPDQMRKATAALDEFRGQPGQPPGPTTGPVGGAPHRAKQSQNRGIKASV